MNIWWLILLVGTTTQIYTRDAAHIIITPTWEPIQTTDAIDTESDWVIIGTITFKKKLPEKMVLKELVLNWHGEYVEDLSGSLFIKKYNKPFMPIEECCVSDSSWETGAQQLQWIFCTPITLSTETTLYITLIIPHALHPALENGYFTLDADRMPPPFKKEADRKQLRVLFDKRR